MRLNKVLKVTYDKVFRNQGMVDRIRDTIKTHIGEDYKILVFEDGMDIEPLDQGYYGIVGNQDRWIMDESNRIIWYPCREIAEAHAQSLRNNGHNVEAKPFNDFEELSDKEKEEVVVVCLPRDPSGTKGQTSYTIN